MRMSVCRLYVFAILALLGVLTLPSTARAQYRRGAVSEGGIAENYHIEAAYGWWNAIPSF